MHLKGFFLAVSSFVLTATRASVTLTNCASVTGFPIDGTDTLPVVRLEGQLLSARYCKKPPHPNCEAYYILSDKSGNITLRASSKTLYKAGDIVRVIGYRSVFNQTFHSVVGTNVTVIGSAEIPSPVKIGIDELKNAQKDLRFVSVSGTIIDAFYDELNPNQIWFIISQNGQTLPISTPSDSVPEDDISELVGRDISVVGLYSIRPHGSRVISSTITANTSNIRLGKKDETDPFAAPVLKSDMPFSPLRRYCITGRVLAISGNNQVIVQPADGSPLDVRLRQNVTPPPVDAHVRFSGFAERSKFKSGLIQTNWRQEPGDPPALQVPIATTPKDILVDSDGKRHIKPVFHNRLIQLSGTLTGDLFDIGGRLQTHLDADGFIVPVEIPRTSAAIKSIKPGSKVALCGVCQLEFDSQPQRFGIFRANGFSLILRSDADIVVIETPSWWTPLRLTILIGVLVLLLAAILLWNLTLRVIAERRGRELFRENVARISADLRTDERTRLAVDLHDSLAQMLTGVSLQIDAGEYEIASKSLKSCRDELRNCLWDLRNQTLEERDMGEAIRRTLKPHIGTAQLIVRFYVPRAKLSDSTAHSVLMIIRELTTNAIRHGHAKTIRVAGGLDTDELRFSVRDDGCGFDPDRCLGMAEGHFGLQGIRERVKRCDGTIAIESAPDRGTRVRISLKRQK